MDALKIRMEINSTRRRIAEENSKLEIEMNKERKTNSKL
jgi:hypothetical protein